MLTLQKRIQITNLKIDDLFFASLLFLTLIYPFIELDIFGLPLAKVYVLLQFLLIIFFKAVITRKIFYLPLLLPFSLLIMAGIISAINSTDPSTTLFRVFLQIIIFYIAILVIYNTCNTISKCYWVLFCMLLSGIFSAVSGWINYFQGNFQSVSLFFPRVTPHPWLGGTHVSLAGLMVVLLPLVCACLLITHSHIRKTILGAIAGLFTITCLFTLSRAGWALLILQTLLWLWWFRRNLWVFWGTIICSFVFIFVSLPSFQTLLGSTVRESSDIARDYLEKLSIELFFRHPFVGVGFGTFTEYNRVVFDSSYYPPRALDAHGVIYKTISEMGLIGLFSVVLIWFFVSFRLITIYIAAKIDRNFRIIMLGCIISFLMNTIFEMTSTRFYSMQYWFPIGWYLAMSGAIREDLRKMMAASTLQEGRPDE